MVCARNEQARKSSEDAENNWLKKFKLKQLTQINRRLGKSTESWANNYLKLNKIWDQKLKKDKTIPQKYILVEKLEKNEN